LRPPAAAGPCHAGHGPPRRGHPWNWSVYRWLDGAPAITERIDDLTEFAVTLAGFLTDWHGGPVWVHGDAAVGDLLVSDGRLRAVIDFGSSGVGDPACDLTIAWTLLSGASRAACPSA
jgi:aminoglycoside phosphotransferase (APT) family kinase protein